MSTTMPPEVLDIEEAKAILGLSRTTIYKRINDGVLHPVPMPPAARKRPRLLFRRADVERLAQPIQRAG